MPEPSKERLRWPSTRWNRSNRRGSSSSGMPAPGVADHHLGRASVGGWPGLDGDLAREGELEGVGKKIEDDLLPHVPVDVDGLGQGRALDPQCQTRAVGGRLEIGRQLGGEGRQVGRLVARLHPPGLDAREVEQRVDELQQPQAVAMGGLETAALRGIEWRGGIAERVLQGPQHQGQRGAEFVADVGEESGLGAVDLRERLRPPPLLLVGLDVGDRGGDLARHQVEEAEIVIVGLTEGIEPDDQDPGSAELAGRLDGQQHRAARGLGPRTCRNRAAVGRSQIGEDPRPLGAQRRRERP